MDFKLKGKVALVTGGGRGIGRACARILAQEGAAVSINYVRDQASADEVARAIQAAGGSADSVQGDVGNFDDAKCVVEQTIQRFGRIDILVNNAGIVSRKSILEIPLDEWDRVVRTNLYGCFHCSQLVGQHMVRRGEGGRIINISSIHGHVAKADMGAYCSTKGAINMFTRQLAVELAPHRITVNAIASGAIATDINLPLYRSSRPEDRPLQQAVLRRIPAGKIGQPEDIGTMAAFLASEQAPYITGAIVYVDGGYVAEGTARL